MLSYNFHAPAQKKETLAHKYSVRQKKIGHGSLNNGLF
jgi:hypothetical protein